MSKEINPMVGIIAGAGILLVVIVVGIFLINRPAPLNPNGVVGSAMKGRAQGIQQNTGKRAFGQARGGNFKD